MLFIDTLLRFSAVTLLLAIAVLSVRDARHLVQGRIAVLLCVTLASMLLTTAPDPLLPPDPVFITLRLIDTANLVFLWWFTLSLFEDGFKLRRLHWIGLLIYAVPGFPSRINYLLGNEPLWVGIDVIVRLASLAMILHMIWTAVAGWRDDLIEVRRRTRLLYTLFLALVAALIIATEVGYTLQTGDRSDPEWLSFSRVALAFPAILFGAYWFLRMRTEGLLFEQTRSVEVTTPSVDVRNQHMHATLLSAIETEHLYREQGLSIGTLAARINVPEHQLRSLINQGLGYRNFAAFLNGYRLKDAKDALADLTQARTPILTIAMDAGFASLATFNRAFKSETGLTPSAYRAKALGKTSQS
ncbi:MAG: helix-turn-helix domain-containing protein [Pseudomonadota bacterium]